MVLSTLHFWIVVTSVGSGCNGQVLAAAITLCSFNWKPAPWTQCLKGKERWLWMAWDCPSSGPPRGCKIWG